MATRSSVRTGGLSGFARRLAAAARRRARSRRPTRQRHFQPGYRSETLESRVMLATVHGVKFEDVDADGVRDPGEPGLGGWTIYADDNQNGFLDLEDPQ